MNMQSLTIKILKDAVFTEVSLASAYAGAKSADDSSDFSRVATVSEDSELLKRFWNDACGEVASRLKEFTVAADMSDEGFQIDLELSGSYDSAMTPSVESDLFSSVSSGVTARWFRFTKPEIATDWEDRSNELLLRAYRKLCYRRRPTRRS